jgi:hypothetical protein
VTTKRSKVADKDRGWRATIARYAKAATRRKNRVRVGILADSGAKRKRTQKPKRKASSALRKFRRAHGIVPGLGNITLLEVAAIQEFGAPAASIPQRSFVRSTVDNNRGAIYKTIGALAKQIARGKLTREAALERVGARVEGMIKRAIADGIEPANAPSTIARKGSSKPLINTGQLRSAVTYEVG